MHTHAYLKRIIGNERTLVITCLECCLDVEQEGNGNVFRYTALANTLNPEDKVQWESILAFVEFKNCSKIIVAGHGNCKALEYLLNGLTPESPIYNLHESVECIVRENHGHLLTVPSRQKMLVELNVIHQCKALLNNQIINERVIDGSLRIIGLVIDPAENHTQVFSNGLFFNDMVSMN
jgi:carbonic anhydrase